MYNIVQRIRLYWITADWDPMFGPGVELYPVREMYNLGIFSSHNNDAL